MLVLYLPSSMPSGNFTALDNTPVPQSVLAQLSVSNNISNAVGIGAAQYKSIVITLKNQTPLRSDNKTQVLYIGAEYCPYCGAERWAMIIAFSRFGTFSGIEYMNSAPAPEVYPDTPTFTFVNATYTSPYIVFTTREIETRTHAPLQNLSSEESLIYSTYDQGGGIPFIDFGNQSTIAGATYDPQTLAGMNWTQVLSTLQNPSTPQAQSIIGSANLITAQICEADGGQPGSVCNQSYVKHIESLVD